MWGDSSIDAAVDPVEEAVDPEVNPATVYSLYYVYVDSAY